MPEQTPYAPPAADVRERALPLPGGVRWRRTFAFAALIFVADIIGGVAMLGLIRFGALRWTGIRDVDFLLTLALIAVAMPGYLLFLRGIRQWRIAHGLALYLLSIALAYSTDYGFWLASGARGQFTFVEPLWAHAIAFVLALGLGRLMGDHRVSR